MKLLYDYKNGSPEGCSVKSLGNIYGVEVDRYKRNIEMRVLHVRAVNTQELRLGLQWSLTAQV